MKTSCYNPWQWHRLTADEDTKITCWLKFNTEKNFTSLQLRRVVCLDLSLHYWKYYQSLHLLQTHTHAHTYRLQYRLATSVHSLVFVQIYREKLNEPPDNLLHEGNLQAISAKCVCRRGKKCLKMWNRNDVIATKLIVTLHCPKTYFSRREFQTWEEFQ